MTILTIELVIVILFSIIRLIGALSDLFRVREEGGGIIRSLIVDKDNNIYAGSSNGKVYKYLTNKNLYGLVFKK